MTEAPGAGAAGPGFSTRLADTPERLSFIATLRQRLGRVGGWRRWWLAVLLGAAAVPALPPLTIQPALLAAFIGLLWIIDGIRTHRAAAAVGFGFGMGYFTAGLYWVANALLTKPEQFGWLAPAAPVGLSLILAPFVIVPVLACRLAPPGVGRVVVFAAAWTVAEWLRSWVMTGFPWNLAGSVWTNVLPMLQITAWIGVYGLGFLTVLAAALPAVPLGDSSARLRHWLPTAAAAAVLVAVGVFGMARLASVGDVGSVEGVRLRLVQPNIPQTIKWRRDLLDTHVIGQARMGSLPAGPPPTHVIWSEVAAPMFLEEDPRLLAAIAAHTPPGGLSLVGTLRRFRSSPETVAYRNSLVVIAPDGDIVAHYDKSHLVPFGEYMPLGALLGLNGVVGIADFTPGPGIATLTLPGLPPVSPLICYEVIFPGRVVDRSARPDWMLNITNDGWYGNSPGPYQHLAAAQARAVEEGLPLVRVANTGISAVIDPVGRIRERLGLGTKGVIDAVLPDKLPPTVYGRFGNGPLLLALLGVALMAVLLSRRN
jgi:apolipoprotein N-acyltransferase